MKWTPNPRPFAWYPVKNSEGAWVLFERYDNVVDRRSQESGPAPSFSTRPGLLFRWIHQALDVYHRIRRARRTYQGQLERQLASLETERAILLARLIPGMKAPAARTAAADTSASGQPAAPAAAGAAGQTKRHIPVLGGRQSIPQVLRMREAKERQFAADQAEEWKKEAEENARQAALKMTAAAVKVVTGQEPAVVAEDDEEALHA